MNPHEIPIPGLAADFAASLRAHLPVLKTERTRLRAPVLGDFVALSSTVQGPWPRSSQAPTDPTNSMKASSRENGPPR